MDPYDPNEINLDIKKKFLMEKINKIKKEALKDKFPLAMKLIKNLTTPWDKIEFNHCNIQRNLWNEVRDLWNMTHPDTAPALSENPYEWDSNTGALKIKKKKAKRGRSKRRCGRR